MTYYERNLPHWHPEARWIFLTWRLHGALPLEMLLRIKSNEKLSERRFARAEKYLDSAASGPQWLKEPRIAEVVASCIRHGAAGLDFYELISFVVMPNHVHILVNPKTPLKRITKGIKGVSSRLANRILNREGQQFWQAESFDHWVRDGGEADKIRFYIEQNPVKAGLVRVPEDWRWSSAARSSL